MPVPRPSSTERPQPGLAAAAGADGQRAGADAVPEPLRARLLALFRAWRSRPPDERRPERRV